MYQFSGKLKSIAIALMIIGVLGIGYGFFAGSNKTIEDAKEAIEHHEAENELREVHDEQLLQGTWREGGRRRREGRRVEGGKTLPQQHLPKEIGQWSLLEPYKQLQPEQPRGSQ